VDLAVNVALNEGSFKWSLFPSDGLLRTQVQKMKQEQEPQEMTF